MSLRPQTCPEVPASTATVARAAFPRGNPYLRLRDALGTVFSDAQFAPLFPSRGQPAEAPWRLALVTVLQFAENLSDRRAAEAVRGRIDWKYLLGLELADPGFDASVLSEFRTRLVTGGAETLLLDTLLALCREHKLLVARGRQRTDSTHVLGAVRALNRLGCAIETLRAALNALATAAPEWLRTHADPTWPGRYAKPADEVHIPRGEVGPANVALVVVEDQSLPGAAILTKAAHDPLAAGLDGHATAGPPEGVGAGVNRVGQHGVEGVVDGQLPGDASALAPIPDRRQRQALVAHPEVNLPNRLQLGKLGEDERDRLLHAAVRILLDAVVVRLEVAYGDGEEELAAAGLLLEGFERALTEERELHLAHGALHAEQKPVVRMARIVDPILIKDQRTDQAAELEQRVPVAAVAGEP